MKTQYFALFLEHNEHILLLQKKDARTNIWKIPGENKRLEIMVSNTLSRQIEKETGLKLSFESSSFKGKKSRINNEVYVYHAILVDKPIILIDGKKYSSYEWVSIYAFKTMSLSKDQFEFFDIAYKDRLWQRVSPNEEGAEQIEQSAHLILNKGVKALTFNENRRFVLNLIGNTGSGKGTQGELLSKLYGIPHISPGNLFRQEFRSESKLAWMMKVYYKEHYPNYFPEEISIGIMTRRLAKVDCQRGFIFDGFPKTEIQTQVASEIFIRNHDFHIPLFMDVSENDILDRLSGRSICNECGHEVRKFDENPWPGFCPIEAKNGRMVELSHRPEDTDPASIERKLSLFRENIGTVLGKIGKRDPICSFQLDNLTTPREVLHQLNNSIQQRLENLWEHENNDRHEQNLFT